MQKLELPITLRNVITAVCNYPGAKIADLADLLQFDRTRTLQAVQLLAQKDIVLVRGDGVTAEVHPFHGSKQVERSVAAAKTAGLDVDVPIGD